MPSSPPPILFLDITRLVRRLVHYGGPTGIDRIEFAYARRRWADDGLAVRFVAGRGPALRLLAPHAVATVLDTLEARWASPQPPGLREGGGRVATAHLRHLRPMPANVGALLRKFDKVLVPEMNSGQLAHELRARYLVDVISYGKVQGQPLLPSEMEQEIWRHLS